MTDTDLPLMGRTYITTSPFLALSIYIYIYMYLYVCVYIIDVCMCIDLAVIHTAGKAHKGPMEIWEFIA